MRSFFNNTGMVISMTLAIPLLISTVPLDQMMNMFVIGDMNMLVVIQIPFVHGIAAVFILSGFLTVPAIIVCDAET